MIPFGLILSALSTAGGGILAASGGRKALDPAALKRLFGPKAVTDEAMEYYNRMLNSPEGQQMLAGASQQGAQFSNALNDRLAQSGLAGGGATTGVGAFQQAAGSTAGASLERGVKSNIYGNALDQAGQSVAARMNAYLGQPALQEPTMGQTLGSALAGAGSQALLNYATAPKTAAGPAMQTAPSAGLAKNFNSLMAEPVVTRGRGNLAGQDFSMGGGGDPAWRGPSGFSRFGRGFGRFGRRALGFVMPGQ